MNQTPSPFVETPNGPADRALWDAVLGSDDHVAGIQLADLLREPRVIPFAEALAKANPNHYPAGTDGGKGGQFAPKTVGTATAVPTDLDLANARSIAAFVRRVKAERVSFPGGQKVYAYDGPKGERRVLDWEPGSDYADDYKAEDWIARQGDPRQFYPDAEDEFHADFWRDPAPLYHGTEAENAAKILLGEGLDSRKESRGMSNEHIGYAVFTSLGRDTPSAYGDTILVIDTKAMKRDGFMPHVSREPAIVEYDLRGALASKLDLDDYDPSESYDGVDHETVIVHDSIPRQYLSLIRSSQTHYKLIQRLIDEAARP